MIIFIFHSEANLGAFPDPLVIGLTCLVVETCSGVFPWNFQEVVLLSNVCCDCRNRALIIGGIWRAIQQIGMLAKVIGQRVTFGAGDPGERVSEFEF
jgi:hypothetical protein